MTISPFDLLLLLGMSQGFILASLLWFNRKGNRLSNRLLAWVIGLLALASLGVSVPIRNNWVNLALDLLPFINAMPLGPLIYFYTKSVLDPTFRLGKWERIQFYPVLIDWGAKLIGWTFVIGALAGAWPSNSGLKWGEVMDEYNTYSDIPRWLSMAVYLVLAKRWLDRHTPTGKGYKVERQQQNVRWVRQLLIIMLVFQVVWFIHLVPYIIPGTRSALLDKFGWYPIYIPIAVLIYWIGLKGYLHARSSSVEPVVRKASTTTLPNETVNQVVESLKKAMAKDKLYLDPELTVDKVGRHLQMPPKTISFVLNQYLQKSFNTFVNEYRIEAVKQRLTDPASEHLTLTGIAFECGFNSQATFQRTFKQMMGVSPTEYVAKQTKTTLKSGFE
ncbi:helix-turn-helix domain-containing protein [Spirosoma soli]|uniref:Helix-turn-helix domain-containing protein n=1 Tax=Spirosoma soli TaxID=1770529 RepID=A0ABW5M2Z2_9BACT